MSLHWTEEQYQHWVRKGQPQPVSEKVFQSALLRLARQAGYLAYFTWSSKRSPEGFPDLVLVHPTRRETPIFLCELKTTTGAVSRPQEAWIAALHERRTIAEVWRPADWERIRHLLSTGEA